MVVFFGECIIRNDFHIYIEHITGVDDILEDKLSKMI